MLPLIMKLERPAIYNHSNGILNTGEKTVRVLRIIQALGWISRTQKDRGFFYQNFALALLESKIVRAFIGSSTRTMTLPISKPILRTMMLTKAESSLGTMYTMTLQRKMKELNTNVYRLIDFFDKQKRWPHPGVAEASYNTKQIDKANHDEKRPLTSSSALRFAVTG